MKRRYRRMIKAMKAGEASGKSVTSSAGETGEPWFVYIVHCADGTFYTGITKDLERRIEEHNAGKGARYTRSRRPVSLVWREKSRGRAEALARECEVKALGRRGKERLVGYATTRDQPPRISRTLDSSGTRRPHGPAQS